MRGIGGDGDGRLRSARDEGATCGLPKRGDGGWGPDPHSTSDVDDTGAVLEALAAAGTRGGPAADRAVAFIEHAQNGDGGMGQFPGYGSNTQSTAWAVQGLVAVGRDPNSLQRGGRTPLGYISSLQQPDGSVRYSSASSQTPVFVTAQAIAALERKAFPLSPLRSGSQGSRGAGQSAANSRAGRGATGHGATAGGAHAAAPGAAASQAVLGAHGSAAGQPRARRASEAVDISSNLPPASVVLLLAGAALLLTGLGGLWRAQRRMVRAAAPN